MGFFLLKYNQILELLLFIFSWRNAGTFSGRQCSVHPLHHADSPVQNGDKGHFFLSSFGKIN